MATTAASPHAQRPPPGGFVQTPKPDSCPVIRLLARNSQHASNPLFEHRVAGTQAAL